MILSLLTTTSPFIWVHLKNSSNHYFQSKTKLKIKKNKKKTFPFEFRAVCLFRVWNHNVWHANSETVSSKLVQSEVCDWVLGAIYQRWFTTAGCSQLHSPADASSFQQHSIAHFSRNASASSPTYSYHFLLRGGSSRATQASPSCCSCISLQCQGCVALQGPLGEINNVSTQETHCLPSGSIFCCRPEQTTERPLCRLSTARPYLSPAASDSVIWRWDALWSPELSSAAPAEEFSFMLLMWPFITSLEDSGDTLLWRVKTHWVHLYLQPRLKLPLSAHETTLNAQLIIAQ